MKTSETIRQARARYFEENGFSEASYSDRWVGLPVGPFRVYLPSPRARRRCIARHDLHHLATDYKTDWRGEFEMSAWELGAGCGGYPFAWLVNTQAVMVGALGWRRVAAAFGRGRRSRSLYSSVQIDDAFLDRPIGELSRELNLAPPGAPPTTLDHLMLAAYIGGVWLLMLGALALPLLWLIGWL